MTFSPTTSPEFFERKYLLDEDPWHFATSAYERQRYDELISALKGPRYKQAFEPGCSIGVFTERLANICDKVIAFDVSPTAVQRARARCNAIPNVQITCRSLTAEMDLCGSDLLVLNEIGYYFEEKDWDVLVGSLLRNLLPGSTVFASHWLGDSDDHLQSGDSIHRHLMKQPHLLHVSGAKFTSFQLDKWVKRDD